MYYKNVQFSRAQQLMVIVLDWINKETGERWVTMLPNYQGKIDKLSTLYFIRNKIYWSIKSNIKCDLPINNAEIIHCCKSVLFFILNECQVYYMSKIWWVIYT